MKILVTGAGGFVAPYVVAAIRREVSPTTSFVLTAKNPSATNQHLVELDICDRPAVEQLIRQEKPTHVIHLAGIAALTKARSNPDAVWQVHVAGTLNVARSILAISPETTLVFVSSGQVYGRTAAGGGALTENSLLAPLDDYAVTKAAADLALGALAGEGLKCLRMRPFNHTGPGQSEDFAVPAFAKQIAEIELGLKPPVLSVGNLDAARDILDVRDVARAYAMAIHRSAELKSGAVFNVASGQAVRIRAVLDMLISASSARIDVELDPNRLRRSDIPTMVGNADLLRTTLGWKPQFKLEETVAAVLGDFRHRVANRKGNP